MKDRLKANYEIYSDKSENPVTTTEYIKHGDKWLDEFIETAGNVVTPEKYGAKGDGVTDDTKAIQDMFDNVRVGTIMFGNNKEYVVKNEITIHAGYTTLTVLLGNIKYVGTANDSCAVLCLKKDASAPLTNGAGGIKIFGGYINCNRLMGCGVRIYDAYHVVIDGVKISDYSNIGIDVGYDGITKGNTLSTQAMISNCYINNFTFGTIGTAIRCVHTDNNFVNCVTNRSKVGIEFRYGGNFLSNCHFTSDSTKLESASEAVCTFIKNNPLDANAVQINSFSNCYFNGTKVKYVIENTANNALITSIDDCSVILGHTDVPYQTLLQNKNYSPLQATNIKVRKSNIHTLCGVLRFTGSTGMLSRSKVVVDNSANKTQQDFDINNMDCSASSFVTGSSALKLPPKTLRRIATVVEPSNLKSGTSIDITLDGTNIYKLYVQLQNSHLEIVNGKIDEHVVIYKDAASRVVQLEDGFDIRAYDIYAYNSTNEDYDKLCIISSENENYPYTQVMLYQGSDNDITTDTLDEYSKIIVKDDDATHDNLVVYPYYSKDDIVSYGVHFVVTDGVIVANGTPTRTGVAYRPTYPEVNSIELKDDVYVFSTGIQPEKYISGCRIDLGLIDTNGELKVVTVGSNPVIIDNTNRLYESVGYISIYLTSGIELIDYTFRPMLERGTVSHPYQPYKLNRTSLEKRISALESALALSEDTENA